MLFDRISRIEKDISDIQKKIADETKKEIDKQKQIDLVNRSITSGTSIATLQSKQRQIQGYQSDILRIQSAKGDLYKKISQKTGELAKVRSDLQKEEIREKDKQRKENEELRRQQEQFNRQQKQYQIEQANHQRRLQADIDRQKEALNTIVHQMHSSQNYSREEKEYDFFISHATEDKDSFARPLAELLKTLGYNVWYDEFQLKLGDSLRKKIDQGLNMSKYGVLVLSRDFFRKNWTEYELNGLVAREMNGRKVILPIWHNVTKDEVLSYSPSLADKVALNTAIYSLKEIAVELGKLLSTAD